MIRSLRLGPAVWLGFAAALSNPAAAAELEHVVRPGESASAIAQRYYGGFEATDLLLRFNDKRGSVIVPGETLRVPYCEEHAVRAGDTWSGIARHYLGNAADYATIARLNGLDPAAPLQAGKRIVVPVLFSHTMGRGETLARIAEEFYGDADRAELLREFNRIDDPRRLAVGREIRIPLTSPLLARSGARPPEPQSEREAKPANVAEPVASPSRNAPRAEAPADSAVRRSSARASRKLRAARQAYREGEFQQALEILESLAPAIEGVGDPAVRTEFGMLLAFVHVAFDRPEEACRAYQAVTGPAAPAPLDPELVSPKIRNILAACGEPAVVAQGG